MPGGFGSDPNEDGGYVFTENQMKVALICENKGRWPATGPGGSGVLGITHAPSAAGVFGANNAVEGNRGRGVQGNGPEAGVAGYSEHGFGVLAQGKIGLQAEGAEAAAHFKGTVECEHDIRLLGADCAEEFNVRDAGVEPGTVMVLEDDGGVRESDRDYDTRVVGVVSGAGSFEPALILDRRPTGQPRVPLALMGKVYCKVDATEIPVAVGDLLTTSQTPGHAMKAADQGRAFGSVIGKALQPCAGTRDLIAILVTLQ